ncbi:helix-turn-helix transcriptional regulator [Verrucosispora sp. WMMA2044]|uniref:helix-turn-helix domain-containing protein n=1 Tax=Verrucosispora sp. WMMA2044 TaxID=3016419 RepID=UPI00248ABEEA|nr:helix-turn-helix transcriptional regulator [Verrucosispora sp. WMMA2044]WBB48498.1 helix-turn-helix transcriptional regulator [Verrucosispora sp. WMMA2044]
MALRSMRLRRNYSLEDVRSEMEWSLSKVVRIESGTVSISVNDLRVLLSLYGVSDPDEVDQMIDLARLARRRHWAAEYRDYVSASYMDFLGYEDDAAQISQYHPFLIPGLLQTEDYARLVVTAGPHYRNDSQAAEARVRLRMARQARVFTADRQCLVRVVLDERALKPVHSPDVMRHQIDKIVKLLPRLDLVVLQQETAAEAGFVGPFSFHEFDSDLDPDVVYLDNQPDDVALVEDADMVDGYKASFRALYDQAVPGEDETAQKILDRYRPH